MYDTIKVAESLLPDSTERFGYKEFQTKSLENYHELYYISSDRTLQREVYKCSSYPVLDLFTGDIEFYDTENDYKASFVSGKLTGEITRIT